jgi:hypothetical protein
MNSKIDIAAVHSLINARDYKARNNYPGSVSKLIVDAHRIASNKEPLTQFAQKFAVSIAKIFI